MAGKKIPRKPMDAVSARSFAEMLDTMECDLDKMQRKMFRLREALQSVVGETVGYQYDDQEAALEGAATPTKEG